jgi:hypothetical protein
MDVNEPAGKASIFNSFLIMHRLTANRQDFSRAASHANSQQDDSRSALVPGLQKRLRLEQSDLSEYACSSTVLQLFLYDASRKSGLWMDLNT